MASSVAASPKRPLAAYQPLSFIYKLTYVSFILVRLPLWILSFALIRSWRLHPEWTLKQTVLLRLTKAMLHMTSRTETPIRLNLSPGKEEDRFEKIEPSPAELYRGPLEGDVAPAAIGGTWFPKKPDRLPSVGPAMTVVFHIHGGAYIWGDGRTDQMKFMCTTLLEHAEVDAVFCPQYRLSCRPTSAAFPAALQDALTSYLYLVRTEGISPASITLSGDSAGGNIAIGLLRYLAHFGRELNIPLPGNAVLISPWTSPLKALWPDVCTTTNPHYSTDYLGPAFGRWGAKTYARDVPATDPYISPLGHPFPTQVPLFVNYGTAEMLEIDGTRWVREMRKVDGNVVEVNYEAAAPHDTLLLGDKLGWEKSAQGVATLIGVFIRESRREGDG